MGNRHNRNDSGNALLANFPGIRAVKRTIPFVDTDAEARALVASIAPDVEAGREPLFITVKHRRRSISRSSTGCAWLTTR